MSVSALQKIFDQALTTATEAQHWVDSGQKWQYCKTCIYAVPTQANDSKPTAFANKKMNANLAANPTLCYPENMVTQVCELIGEYTDFIFGGGFVVAAGKGSIRHELLNDLPVRHYKFIQPRAFAYMQEHGGMLCFVKTTGFPIIRLMEGDEMLFVLPAYEKEIEDITFKHEGRQYKCVGWIDDTRSYARIEETQVADFSNLIGLGNKQVAEVLGETQETLQDQGVIPSDSGSSEMSFAKDKDAMLKVLNSIPAGANRARKKPAQEPEQPKQTEKEDPVKDFKQVEAGKVTGTIVTSVPSDSATPDEQAEAPKAEPKAEPVQEETKKNTRRKTPKGKCADLTDIIEQVAQDVPDDMSVEDVLKEIRQLRDLMIAASRRSANLALKYLDKASDAETKITQLKELLKC